MRLMNSFIPATLACINSPLWLLLMKKSSREAILSAEFVQLVQLLVQITIRKQKDLLMITSPTMWLMNQHTRVCHNHCICFVGVKMHFFWAVLFKVHFIFYSSLFVSIYSVRRRWRQVQYDWTCAEFIMNSHEIKWNRASLSGLEWSPGSLRVWPKCCLSLTTSTERLRRTRRTRSTRRLENKAREYLTFKKCQFVLWAHRLCAACLSLGNNNTNTKLTECLMEFNEQLNQPHCEAAWCCPTGLKD